MFSPVPMLKFKLLILEQDERRVLRTLAGLGAVQLEQTEISGEPLARRDYVAKRQRCTQLISQSEELRRALLLPNSPGTPLDITRLSLEKLEEGLASIVGLVEPLLKRRQVLLQQWTRLKEGEEKISKYKGYGFPLTSGHDYGFLHFITGTVPSGNVDVLQGELPEPSTLLLLRKLNDRQILIAMSTRTSSAALRLALERAGFVSEDLPQTDGDTVDSLLEHTREEQARILGLLEQVDARLQLLGNDYKKTLAQYTAAASLEQSLLTAEENFAHTGSALLIAGWVPAIEAPTLRDRLAALTAGRCAFQTTAADPHSREQVPVLLRHPAWLRPFEPLLTTYGLPHYNELEPTLFVAVSFLVMFGMMFGDVGHGAILVAIGCLCNGISKNPTWRNSGRLLLFAGLFSIGFGFVYGSCFGLPAFKRFALWRDPLEGDPLSLISAALGLGIALISLGLVLNVINRFRLGDVLGAIFGRFGLLGIIFYSGAVLLLLVNAGIIQSHGLRRLAALVVLVTPLFGWALKEPLAYLLRPSSDGARPPDGWFGVVAESVVGSFEAILSYLANTISFVRLAAYAMSHAALLAAAFTLASALTPRSAGGLVLSSFIVIAGNLVAIILEGLIASVQALRLEYYEFFSKFFSGTGKPFKPFRLAPMPST